MLDIRSLLRSVANQWPGALAQELARVLVAGLVLGGALLIAHWIPPVQALLVHELRTTVRVAGVGLAAAAALGGLLAYLVLARRMRTLARLAATDDLTMTYNSRELSRRIEEEAARGRRHQRPFCLILIDIDHLKETNDRYGYEAGDALLREFAQFAGSHLRASDIFGRYRQGDEFAILAVDTSLLGARILAERLRGEIERYRFFASSKGRSFSITFSAGVADFQGPGDTAEALQKRAEAALARAKRTRNAVALVEGSAGSA